MRNHRPSSTLFDDINQTRGRPMSIFQIRQTKNGAVLWTGAAEDEATALDAMAREAGYRDFSALPEAVRADGVEAAKLDLIS